MKPLILLLTTLVLSGCTYNHYYQGDTEMVPTPTSDAAMPADIITPGKVIIYRVH
ncbi:hypothetical protein [Maribrevibacterium harenarium]|jgi:hypothetical protein|uniref:hypothetical protein n=1 Tax=Maribrevibacterium harenarium TaxID=2589817 RepID=UPI0015E2C763|nr:hypothetical protein [Maribrevibacterium harenarium]